MSVQVEKLEKNMAKLTVEVEAEKFVAATVKVYNKQKNQINVQGFRKGKAPQAIIEKMYGAGIFYEDAANMLIPVEYEKAAEWYHKAAEKGNTDAEFEITQELYDKMFGIGIPLGDDVDIRFLAERFEFVGGNIKNCILNAAFLAAADGDGKEVGMKHYLQAIKYEFVKTGKVFTRADFEPYASLLGL